MDQIKIGKFISECRRQQGFTQMQLSEKLGITDKAVSKWERGIAMPDTSIMLALCELLGISVNELLCGEKIMSENENQKNEQLMIDMARELERKNKTVWTSMWIILGVSMLGLFAGLAIAKFLIPAGIWQIVTILGSLILFLIPCFYALKLEVSIGAYKCGRCGHKIVPTYTQALMAMHFSTTRFLKCPKCQRRSWCKKSLDE